MRGAEALMWLVMFASAAAFVAARDVGAAGDEAEVTPKLIAGVSTAELERLIGQELALKRVGPEGAHLRSGECHIGMAVLERPEVGTPLLCVDEWGNISDGRLADLEGGPGDTGWSTPDLRSVWFRRRNVVCHVRVFRSTEGQTLALAERIDKALQESEELAPKGDKVVVPRIAISVLDPPKCGTTVRVRFEVAEGPPVLWWDDGRMRMSEGPVTSGVVEYKCDTPGERTGTFWLVTEMNVVANTRFAFTVPEPENEGGPGQ